MIHLETRNFVLTYLTLLLACSANLTWAQENSQLTFSGYLDAYYAYDFNKPGTQNRQFTNTAARHNEFNINHAYILGNYESDKTRAVLGLQIGTYPLFNYAAEPNEMYRLIYQAYGGVKLSEKVWLDAGMFPGHTGYEAVESIENELYTRALSTEYTPYYETGVRVTAEVSDKVTLTGVILNGWQNIGETNDSKAFGMTINYLPNSELELNYGNYFGDEGDGGLGSLYRSFHHAYVKYTFSDKFHAMLSLDHGRQELQFIDTKGTFYFYTFITQYFVSPKVSLALRFEEVNDDDNIISSTEGVSGFSGQVYTFNFNYHISENALFRIESKFYEGSRDVFFGDTFPKNSTQLLAASIAIKL